MKGKHGGLLVRRIREWVFLAVSTTALTLFNAGPARAGACEDGCAIKQLTCCSMGFPLSYCDGLYRGCMCYECGHGEYC